MSKFPITLSIAFLLLILASCRTQQEATMSSLQKKAEPYDQFAWQRAYPDRTFDWKGWRNAMQETRLQETAVQRLSSCGGSNPVSWTQQGPGNVAGRLNALAVHPENDSMVLAGFSGGGLFKSTDAGTTWTSVFDENPELSIGDITFDPSNPSVVYAGTGDPNIPSIVFNGSGIFKSSDTGETWEYIGLEDQGIISKVVVDPNNSTILYAAAMGNPYVRDNERGIYKSTDGGLNWTQVLFVSDQAGASDLVINEDNPQILYASFWDRIRSNQESIIYGPHAKVYKSSDGGATWDVLGGGLPTAIMGRTGLAISKQDPNKVYAIFVDTLSRPGGLYKTLDGGNTWEAMNINGLQDAYADFGWYFGKVRINDANDDDVYVLGILCWRKTGSSWQIAAGAHADCHDLVFTPSGFRYLATDGGLYTSFTDPGPGFFTSWTKSKNLPTTQFYHTSYNPHEPGTYYGGAQDNGIQKSSVAGFNNWVQVFTADGFHTVFDPTDPNHFWAEIQNGTIHETTTGGDSWTFGQSCLGTTDRCNWDTPFFISQHPNHWLYSATYKAYASTSGSSWGSISGDLTDGQVYEDRFHTVSSIAESPITEGKLIAGTSDGNVWWRTPAGDWTNISAGLPDRYVTSVYGSPSFVNTFYVTHSGFRDNEIIPHVHRSSDNGQTWLDISSNLPQIPVNDLLVLPGHSDSILFAATDGGVYFTLNSGSSWTRLGANMPYVPVFEVEENPVLNQLVAATFGRGMWTFPLDSLYIQGGSPGTITVSGMFDPVVDQVDVNYNGGFQSASGSFILNNIPACDSVWIKPQSDFDPLQGVSTYDLVLISKHILNIEPLTSPYSIIAADGNNSGTITTFDIVEIRKLILGIYNELPSNYSWRFIPKTYTFQNPSDPFSEAFPQEIRMATLDQDIANADFWSVKIGDVNGMYGPSAQAIGTDRDEKPEHAWPIKVQTQNTDGKFMVDFQTSQAGMSGLQFTLLFDASSLEFEQLIPLNPAIGMQHFNMQQMAYGKLPVCIDLPEGLNSTDLFRLVFKSKSDSGIKPEFKLISTPTPALAYDTWGQVYLPVLQAGPATAALAYPNPFSTSGVTIDLLEWENGEFQLFDVYGQLIYETTIEKSRVLHLPASLFKQAGSYLFSISNGRERTQGQLEYTGTKN
jgi:photosystem II stability/assembly factor-like uncharacterized protein